MKTAIIKNYIQGLASFLDKENVQWEVINGDIIKIYYYNEEELFRIAFNFGKFYGNN